jgi:preprotein translocase subunit SecG
MFYTLLFIHILLCVVLIGLVLMQQGKGADMGAAFGGNSSSLFGAGGATDFVTKLTTSLAIAFMATSILLLKVYINYSHGGGAVAATNPLEGSIMKQEAPVVEVPAADVPGAQVAAPAAVQIAPVENKAAENKVPEKKPVESKAQENKPAEANKVEAKKEEAKK